MAAGGSAPAPHAMFDLNTSDPGTGGAGPSTPSRRSRLADRTSSILSQLHPSRWVQRNSGGSGATSGSSHHHAPGGSKQKKHVLGGPICLEGKLISNYETSRYLTGDEADAALRSAAHALITKAASAAAAAASPATMAHSREKAKRWVREQASRFLESYFKESLGSRHPALTILRRLSAQVDHLTRKPKDGERSLKEILSILHENDISPFEVTQVWCH